MDTASERKAIEWGGKKGSTVAVAVEEVAVWWLLCYLKIVCECCLTLIRAS